MVKSLPVMQETWVWYLGWEDPLEDGMAIAKAALKNKIADKDYRQSCHIIKTMFHASILSSVTFIFQFSSVTQSNTTLCDPMDCSMPGFPDHHQLLEFTQTHVHWISDAIQPSHPLSSPSPPAFNLSQHQGLFQWVISSHQMARVL